MTLSRYWLNQARETARDQSLRVSKQFLHSRTLISKAIGLDLTKNETCLIAMHETYASPNGNSSFIAAIKRLRNRRSLGLRDAKELCDVFRDAWRDYNDYPRNANGHMISGMETVKHEGYRAYLVRSEQLYRHLFEGYAPDAHEFHDYWGPLEPR